MGRAEARTGGRGSNAEGQESRQLGPGNRRRQLDNDRGARRASAARVLLGAYARPCACETGA
eukprot:534948-Pleurochrysis_carterae.AAC.3